MRFYWFAAVAIILVSGLASAIDLSSFSGEYDIQRSSVQVTLDLTYPQETSDAQWLIPSDASEIGVSVQNYTVLQTGNVKRIEINEPVNGLTIRYTTSTLLEHGKEDFFILDISKVRADNITVLAKLPETATLKYPLDSQQSSVMPKTSSVITDGQRIIVKWNKADFTSSQATMIMYVLPVDNDWLLLAIIIGVVIVAVALVSVFALRQRHAAPLAGKAAGAPRRDLTRNLFEEEKLVVETLLSEKTGELWQKQLEIKTGLNKVKLSRKLRSLEQKGVLERIPYGNTNKVRLKTE